MLTISAILDCQFKNQRNCIKFCVKTEIEYAKTFEMLTGAFDESTMIRTQVQYVKFLKYEGFAYCFLRLQWRSGS